jgi:hypothetical protein
MEYMAPFLVPMTLFVSMAAIFIFRGPLGKAIGERIAGRRVEGDAFAETEALHAEVEELRHRVGEVEERLDFTERLLAQHKETNVLPGNAE